MTKSRGALALAAAVVTLCVGVARTADEGISAKKIYIRDNADQASRYIANYIIRTSFLVHPIN